MENDLIRKGALLDMLYNYEQKVENAMHKGMIKATILQTLREIIGDVDGMKSTVPMQVETNLFDKEEIYPDCTVQVLTNTVTGEVSVGWWKNHKEGDN